MFLTYINNKAVAKYIYFYQVYEITKHSVFFKVLRFTNKECDCNITSCDKKYFFSMAAKAKVRRREFYKAVRYLKVHKDYSNLFNFYKRNESIYS